MVLNNLNSLKSLLLIMIKHLNNKIIIKNKSIIQEKILVIIPILKIKEEEKKLNYKIK